MSSIEAVTSSIEALTQQYRTITHNLANASTIGYKRRVGAFSQVLNQQAAAEGASAKVVGAEAIDFSQGGLAETGRPLDLALHGQGFFVIDGADGPLYTRCGAFHVDRSGRLVDGSGRAVRGTTGLITIGLQAGPSQVKVSPQGHVSVAGRRVGQLELADFKDRSQLEPVTGGCFRAPAGLEVRAPAKLSVQQGYRESSNVNIVEELVGLIATSRLYEYNFKTVSITDEKLKRLLEVAMG